VDQRRRRTYRARRTGDGHSAQGPRCRRRPGHFLRSRPAVGYRGGQPGCLRHDGGMGQM
ncbi:MAG: hypothetical protein AVDCRST_MAG83-3194, partial [uncultured Arthrobacter sp.]